MYGKLLGAKEIKKNNYCVEFENREVAVRALTDEIINFFSAFNEKDPVQRSFAIEGDKQTEAGAEMSVTESCVSIKTAKLEVRICDNFKVEILDAEGQVLCADYNGEREPFARGAFDAALMEMEGHKASAEVEQKDVRIVKRIFGDEKFYGLGENTGHLNKRYYEYVMWNSDIPDPHAESFASLYKSIPFFITLRDMGSYGIFFDNTFKSKFSMGKENSKYYLVEADGGNLDYYFMYGPSVAQVLKNYTYLTGRTPLPQLWTLGYQQCRWSYKSAAEVREIVKGMKDNQIPCDAIYLDIDYMDNYKVFTVDENKFPNPKEFIKELRDQGIKTVTIIDPGVKKEKGYFMCDEGLKNNYFAVDKDGVPYVNAVWPGDSLFPDFTNTNTRKWWAEKQKIMMDYGVAGIWNDMNEPASFKGPLPDDVTFDNDGLIKTHDEVHNVYGLLMSKATNEGRRQQGEENPFIITRACYAGVQKYSTVWTGDNQSTWEHLRMAVPMLMNLGLSGVAFCGTDVGGFSFDCTQELLARWYQIGCFTPLFRNHSAGGTRSQEPWRFGEETLAICKKYIKLRYRLLPYIYDLFKESEQNGLPIMRPLFMHYQNDKNTHELNDQFMVGDKIMVAPVLEQGKTFRAVYLPEGEWVDYWTKEVYKGGATIIANAPLDTCPIYVKKNSEIPVYDEEIMYVGEKDIEPVIEKW